MQDPVPQHQHGEVEEQLLFELTDVELTHGGKVDSEGTGTLRVTSKRLAWEGGAAGRFEVEIPCVTLHAISKDPASFPRPCLYCQVRGVAFVWFCGWVFGFGIWGFGDGRTADITDLRPLLFESTTTADHGGGRGG